MKNIETATATAIAEPEPVAAATDVPETDIATTTTTAAKLLSFTVVHGWLRGDHRCPFELHATGCRDLKKLLRNNMWSYELLARDRDSAMDAAFAEHGQANVWTQPCCLLRRMQDAGRAPRS